MNMNTFWERLKAILNESEILIDRPKGSRHPKYPKIVFPLDYGYLKDTSGGMVTKSMYGLVRLKKGNSMQLPVQLIF